jgi:hypothetical protein
LKPKGNNYFSICSTFILSTREASDTSTSKL